VENPEFRTIGGQQYQVIKDPDFLDIPLTRKNIKVTEAGSKSFRFTYRLDSAACAPQKDGTILKADADCATTVEITVNQEGLPETIKFGEFKNVKGDGTVLGKEIRDTKITEARFIKQKNETVDGKYDIDIKIPFAAKNWKIQEPPSLDSFYALAGKLALRMKENGLLEGGRHPELCRLADIAEAAESSERDKQQPPAVRS